jgi:hypothetical protein
MKVLPLGSEILLVLCLNSEQMVWHHVLSECRNMPFPPYILIFYTCMEGSSSSTSDARSRPNFGIF